MIEITIEPRPPIPAILRLRERYRGNRAGYARDKMRRNRIMTLRRPTWGDRMDKAAEAAFRRQQDELAREEEKAERRAEEQARRVAKRAAQDRQPYRGRHQL